MAADVPCIAQPNQARHKPPAPVAGSRRALKSSDKFFKKYTWAADDGPAEGYEQRKELSKQVRQLCKANAQLKPSDPRRAEAERLLGILRRKARDAAQREGRRNVFTWDSLCNIYCFQIMVQTGAILNR